MLAKFWSDIGDGGVKCELCPRYCKLGDGEIGFCHIRKNVDGKLNQLSGNTLHALAIDPIEKKPLNHFYPGSKVLSVGTVGCNLSCNCCQNWSLSRSDMREGDTVFPEKLVELAIDQKCLGIAYTYNEPIVFAEYVMETSALARSKGLKNVVVSAGYINESVRESFFENIDAANIDLKSFNEKTYRSHCKAELAIVLDTLKFLKDRCWLEITTLVIPGLNDSDKEMDQLTRWIVDELGVDVPFHLSAFHPDYKMLDTPATSLDSLLRIKSIAQRNGLNHIYLGNVIY